MRLKQTDIKHVGRNVGFFFLEKRHMHIELYIELIQTDSVANVLKGILHLR